MLQLEDFPRVVYSPRLLLHGEHKGSLEKMPLIKLKKRRIRQQNAAKCVVLGRWAFRNKLQNRISTDWTPRIIADTTLRQPEPLLRGGIESRLNQNWNL